ncbi:hypothetical protein KXW98_007937 [Aspergillus fumigatus]|uniref:Uncharacterized protein n=3 Tax=Aspergillus fumigatus TaxID=746128 RepID=Q4WUW7_ASPFU|nr:conserved hypothetical protein [Aspergillus fumigatus Af293]EDP51736.1 conserved hypothetical protein [Aspergillus fumigatus A1163]KAF4252597.1 hypothetical protein CNMCM8057_005942 [Aspergillus fumigatus]EAL91609.1 conserved hypothetical protein [Aspergillus fumigatus Af293]KAF4259022.1 hypothetical protein CNMCM8812_006003 [Aspergillus fumigatus]KAF4276999.1 hypothetical protein CNMCM8689_005215 [Aspergillus fumigatus]
MASLSLEYRAEHSSPELHVFNILNDYLQPSSTTPPSEAAQSIHALTPKAASTQEDSSDLEGFLWSTWGSIIKVAKQIPYNHPSQDRLVDLIHALTKLPPRTVSIWGSENCLWEDLPMLGPTLRESWNAAPTYTKASDQEITEWINLQAFTARLCKSDRSLSLLGVWSLRSGLERELSDEELDGEVAAAAMWMVYGGENLFSQLTHEVPDQETERMMRPGPLFSGLGQLSPERWQFWKLRFEDLSEQIQVTDETKQVIRLAREKMERVQQ